MFRNALERPKASGRPMAQTRNGRLSIPEDTGRGRSLETMIVLCTMAVLAVALGFAVGVPVAMMLHDMCISIKC